jgi:asparagine synthase (glutamine-hydrolysing)
VLIEALDPGPCFVAFSGGRDSSAVLAAATQLARFHGLPSPIPVTERYRHDEAADETEWQELVVEHLQLQEWMRIELDGENDLVGPVATSGLVSRGLIWPVPLQIKTTLLRRLPRGASLLTGEGGDEVFGARRALPWARLRRQPDGSRRQALAYAAKTLGPRSLRAGRAAREYKVSGLQPWLRAPITREHYAMVAADLASEPLSWARSVRWLRRRRGAVVSFQNYRTLAAEFGISLGYPLLDDRFISSFAQEGGALGYPSRTAAMRAFFSDVLPDRVLARTSKAYFNRAFMGEATREFARAWTGVGVDQDHVDIEILRDEWLSARPSALSGTLLHSAWLATMHPSDGSSS